MKDTEELVDALLAAQEGGAEVRIRVYSEPTECNWVDCDEDATRVVAIDIDGEGCASFGACEAHANHLIAQCSRKLGLEHTKDGTVIDYANRRAN